MYRNTVAAYVVDDDVATLFIVFWNVCQRPALEHVLQHGLVGLGQHPRLLQPLQAQEQREEENVSHPIKQCQMSLASPVPTLTL